MATQIVKFEISKTKFNIFHENLSNYVSSEVKNTKLYSFYYSLSVFNFM